MVSMDACINCPSEFFIRKSKESENDILKRVRKIEIKTRGLSNEIFAGKYHTAIH